MLYLFAIVVYFGGCLRLSRALAIDKPLLIEKGAPALPLTFLQWSLWLFVIPLLASVNPLHLLWPNSVPFLVAFLLFVPAIAFGLHVLGDLPKGGYDYQRKAAGHIKEIIWLGMGGASLLLVVIYLAPLLGWAISSSG